MKNLKIQLTWWIARMRAKWVTLKWRFALRRTPGCTMSGGKGGSSTDTAFSRVGTDNKTSGFTIPSNLVTLIDNASNALSLDAGDPQTSLWSTVMGNVNSTSPGDAQLQSILTQSATNAPWYQQLLTTANRSPYSSTYEADTQDAYTNRLNNTLAGLDSATVRTGTNHHALLKGQAVADANRMRGEELARQRSADAGIIGQSQGLIAGLDQLKTGQAMGAAQMLNQNQNARIAQALEAGNQRTQRASAALGGLGQSARLRGTTNETVNTNLSGRGYQEGSQWNVGASVGDVCCFIFLEVLNGPLPPYVRRGRDEFQTPSGLRGYRWMANWLVPKMRVSRVWRGLVNVFMVKPIMRYGAFYYNVEEKGQRWGWACKPVLHAWLNVWSIIGKTRYGI
jgi:hypothetical protein